MFSAKKFYKIGIDVGGTNTDIILFENDAITATYKTITTDNILDGIKQGVSHVLLTSRANPADIHRVVIGTTHLLNALLQNQVEKVGIIRLAKPATDLVPPLSEWPVALAQAVNGFNYIVSGGYNYDGTLIAPLNKEELEKIAQETLQKNITYIAITGIYSHVNPSQELAAAKLLKKINPNLIISLSHENDGSLLERENATIIDAALKKLLAKICEDINELLISCRIINAKLYLSHNDGTVSSLDNEKSLKPISMLISGPTNSLRGAALIAKEISATDKVLFGDIGGTSTDWGKVYQGKPEETHTSSLVAGVQVKLSSLASQSYCFGGGTTIIQRGDTLSFGYSIAKNLTKQSQAFGGDSLTVTDIALAKGRISVAAANKEKLLQQPKHLIEQADELIHTTLATMINDVIMKLEDKPEVLVLGGGGAALIDADKLKLRIINIKKIVIPQHASVANAAGAALAQIGGTFKAIYDYNKIPRELAIQDATNKASEKAKQNGAKEKNLELKSLREIDIKYVLGEYTELQVKVAGDIDPDFVPSQQSIREQDVTINLPEETISDTANTSSTTQLSTQVTVMENTSVKADISQLLQTKKSLALDDVEAYAIGCGILGSGGGGTTNLVKKIVKRSIVDGKQIKILELDKLPDDARVICFGAMGSPNVGEEKLPSANEIAKSILIMEQKIGRKIDAIVIMEGGGANGLFPLLAAAELNIPVIDGDTMARALPGINMGTPTIYGSIKQHIAVVANINSGFVIEAEDAKSLEEKTREIVGTKMGGVTFLSYNLMDGITVKNTIISGTFSTALRLGQEFLAAKKLLRNPIIHINQFLKNTEYKEMKELYQGTVIDIRKKEQNGFVGGVVVMSNGKSNLEVSFQNENLIAREKVRNQFTNIIAMVPDLITFIDEDTYFPVSVPEVSLGQKLKVISLNAPQILKTSKALAVVGPEAFGFKLVKAAGSRLTLLSSSTDTTDSLEHQASNVQENIRNNS